MSLCYHWLIKLLLGLHLGISYWQIYLCAIYVLYWMSFSFLNLRVYDTVAESSSTDYFSLETTNPTQFCLSGVPYFEVNLRLLIVS